MTRSTQRAVARITAAKIKLQQAGKATPDVACDLEIAARMVRCELRPDRSGCP